MAVPSSFPGLVVIKLVRSLYIALGLTSVALAANWQPINPAELADSKPKVDPDARAEILLREVQLDYSHDPTEKIYYVRAKIFSESGIEDFLKVEIPYKERWLVRDIAARTIKPDGTTVELNSKDIFDREAIKADNVRERVKSFAMPGLTTGCIVEYTYTLTTDEWGGFIPLIFQNEWPSRVVRFKVKLRPRIIQNEEVRTISFNCPQRQLQRDADDFNILELTDLPAAKEEPYQPPEINTLSSILFYFSSRKLTDIPAEYWSDFGRSLHKQFEPAIKTTKTVRTTLDSIVGKNDSQSDKLHAIYDYCRTKLLNRHSETSGLTTKQLEKLERNETATDTLKSGSGTHRDINLAFAALLKAAGFDVRYAACNNRKNIMFNPTVTESNYTMTDRVVAVRVGDKWQYFDPGCMYLPFGLLRWINTETAVLRSDPDGKAKLDVVHAPEADNSMRVRSATLVLDDEGTLEGDVAESCSGYREVALKEILDGKTDSEREAYIREEAQEYQKLAEITQVSVQNASNPIEQLKIKYHLRIPQYADRTASRLFLQPAVFQKGAPAWFESANRRTAIVFDYCFLTKDEISIKLPEGAVLEEAGAPEDLKLGQLGNVHSTLRWNRKSATLVYSREFKLAGIAFPRNFYPAIKAAFEQVQKHDAHTLTIRLGSGTAQNGTKAPSSAVTQADHMPNKTAAATTERGDH